MKYALALLSILGLTACQSSDKILSYLSEMEANEIVVVLDSQNIAATKISVPAKTGNKPPTYSIEVPKRQVAESLRILVDNRVPKPKSAGLAEVYPTESSGLIPSRTEEKAKFLRATQGEIENMLKVLPDIVEVRAIIVLPDQNVVRDMNASLPKATASVAVVYNPIDAEGTLPVKSEEIKYLVASAVEDLSPSSVTVVMSQNTSARLVGLPRVVKHIKHEEPKSHPAHHLHPKQKKHSLLEDDLMVSLFGVLAIAGILLGLFGILRNRSLRAQLAKALEAHAEAGAGAPPPTPSEEPPAESQEPNAENTPEPKA
ncbi:MAG: hypothetical protein JKY15_02200 [Deltaproteobacteria bacterium]|nr:hypothetical protein [Deltaproteobacteria bacterium]